MGVDHARNAPSARSHSKTSNHREGSKSLRAASKQKAAEYWFETHYARKEEAPPPPGPRRRSFNLQKASKTLNIPFEMLRKAAELFKEHAEPVPSKAKAAAPEDQDPPARLERYDPLQDA